MRSNRIVEQNLGVEPPNRRERWVKYFGRFGCSHPHFAAGKLPGKLRLPHCRIFATCFPSPDDQPVRDAYTAAMTLRARPQRRAENIGGQHEPVVVQSAVGRRSVLVDRI